MIPCPACGHVVRTTVDCPFCGSAPRLVRATATAVLLGLAACAGADDKGSHSGDPPTKDTSTMQADYGVSTYVSADTGTTN